MERTDLSPPVLDTSPKGSWGLPELGHQVQKVPSLAEKGGIYLIPAACQTYFTQQCRPQAGSGMRYN